MRERAQSLEYSGFLWCLIGGLFFGGTNVCVKISFEEGMGVMQLIFVRNFVLMTLSYAFGKTRGVSFAMEEYTSIDLAILTLRSIVSLVSKGL